MSSITIVPGTQPNRLMHRFLVMFQTFLATGWEKGNPATTGSARRDRQASDQFDLAPDPLDDLQNATWEDAAWQ